MIDNYSEFLRYQFLFDELELNVIYDDGYDPEVTLKESPGAILLDLNFAGDLVDKIKAVPVITCDHNDNCDVRKPFNNGLKKIIEGCKDGEYSKSV